MKREREKKKRVKHEAIEKCLIFNNTQHILFTVIWRWTYGKGPFR